MPTLQLTIIFALAAMVLWGLGDFLIQKTVKRIGDFQTLLVIDLMAGILLIPFIWRDLSAIFYWPNFISLAIMTLIDLFYGLFLLKAYDQGKLAVIEMIMIGELPSTIILGLIFFHEKLNFLQTLIIVMVIVGIILVAKSRSTLLSKLREFFTGRPVIWEKGVLFAVAAFIFSAIYNFLTAVNARSISVFTAVWFPWMLSSLILLTYVAYKKGLKSLWRNSLKNKRLILFTGIIDIIAWVFYAFATVRGEISVIATIVAGYAVIALILAVKFNNERLSFWQYFGATIVFLGVIIMSFIS